MGHRARVDDGIEYLLWRRTLADGRVTTLYATRHPRATAWRAVSAPMPVLAPVISITRSSAIRAGLCL